MNARFVVLAVGTFAVGTDALIIAGILPELARDPGISEAAAGLVVSVFSLTYALAAPFLAAMTAPLRRGLTLVGGLAVFAVANLVSAAAPNFLLLLASRVLAALAAGVYSPAAYALTAALAPPARRGAALAIVAAGFSSATVLGVPLGVLVPQHFGWRAALLFVSALAVAAAAALLRAGVPEPAIGQRLSLRERLEPITRVRTLLVLAPFLLWSAGMFQLYTFIRPVLAPHVAAEAIPGLLLLFGLGSIAGNFVGGHAHDRLGGRTPMVMALGATAAVIGAIDVEARALVGAGAALTVWALGMSALYTLQQQRATDVDPAHGAVLLSLNNSAMYLGASIGAAIGGWVLAASGPSRVPLSSAAALLAGLALFVLTPERMRPGGRTVEP